MDPHIFKAKVEGDRFKDGADACHAWCPDLKGCHTWGRCEQAALARLSRRAAEKN